MRRRLIADGYNIIHASPALSALFERDPDVARARLVADVAALAISQDLRATVVFDAAANPASRGEPHEITGVEIVFSAYGHDADETIELLVAAARSAGEDVTLVTSDAETQWVAMGAGAHRVSSAEFLSQTLRDAEEWRDHAGSGSSRGRVEDALDPETRRALSRWARG